MLRLRRIAELADDAHADRLLRLDEFGIEERDQRLALARLQRVAPKLENGVDGRIGASVRDRSVH